jgi:hypothetical protein
VGRDGVRIGAGFNSVAFIQRAVPDLRHVPASQPRESGSRASMLVLWASVARLPRSELGAHVGRHIRELRVPSRWLGVRWMFGE